MSQNASRAPGAEAMALSGALVEALTAFAARLRWIGLDLSIVELTDALRAVQHGGLDDRDRLRRLLRITMVKRSADIAAFDTAFDLFFPAAAAGRRRRTRAAGERDRGGTGRPGRPG